MHQITFVSHVYHVYHVTRVTCNTCHLAGFWHWLQASISFWNSSTCSVISYSSYLGRVTFRSYKYFFETKIFFLIKKILTWP